MAIRTDVPRDYTFPASPDAAAAPIATPASEWRLRAAAIFSLAIGALGIVARDVVVSAGAAEPIPTSNNVFFRLYGLHEAPFFWMLALTGVLVWVATHRSAERANSRPTGIVGRVTRVPPWPLAAAVLGLTAAGSVVVMHGVGLSMDEFAATFQARIFASGRVEAPVPPEWRGLAPWMAPVFVNYKPADGVWVASYLPVYAAIRALFSLARAEWLTNPALAAATVVLLVAVARRLWTGDRQPRGATLAVGMLVLSSQFLITSMSGYSMPAHLCLNLLWLWLYLRNDTYSLAALPVVGVLALGLHNPVPHALFAAPFLLRLVRDRRFGWAAYCAAIYLAGAAGWYAWLGFVHDGIQTGAGGTAAGTGVASGFLTNISLPGAFRWFVQGMGLTLFFAWQTPALALLFPIGVMAWRRLGAAERDLAVGILATWGFYALVNADQGHGWGYRYLYPVLGSAALLAARGAEELRDAGRGTLVGRLVLTSALVTLAVQLPLRAAQVERFVQPYATALRYVATRRAEVVAVEPALAWYARDLIRNDPLLETTPKVVGLVPKWGRGPDTRELPPSARGRVHLLTIEEFERLGLPVFRQTRP